MSIYTSYLSAVAFPLAVMLNKPLIHVRKSKGHSKRMVEGYYGAKTYVIVDDFIESGKTLREIKNHIIKAHKNMQMKAPRCIAVVLYNGNTSESSINNYQEKVDMIFKHATVICTT